MAEKCAVYSCITITLKHQAKIHGKIHPRTIERVLNLILLTANEKHAPFPGQNSSNGYFSIL